MSSHSARPGLLTGLALLLAGVIAPGQDGRKAEPAGQGALDIFNVVEGRAVVVASATDGKRVEKGEVVCELDTSDLRGRLATQEIIVRAAEFDFQGATLAREATGMRIVEYVEGQVKNELVTIAREIKLAEARLARAEDQMAWSRRMFEKGYASKGEAVTDELTLKEARFQLEATQFKRKFLLDYTKDRSLKTLRSEAEVAKSVELLKQAALGRERSAQNRLQDQIAHCKVTAPAAGRVKYVTPIVAGAVVRDGQLLFRIIADGASTTARAK